jgi:hypothetical protein
LIARRSKMREENARLCDGLLGLDADRGPGMVVGVKSFQSPAGAMTRGPGRGAQNVGANRGGWLNQLILLVFVRHEDLARRLLKGL